MCKKTHVTNLIISIKSYKKPCENNLNSLKQLNQINILILNKKILLQFHQSG